MLFLNLTHFKVTIGQRDGPSVLDIKRMNLLYKCNGGGGGNGGGNGGGGGGGGGGGEVGGGGGGEQNRANDFFLRFLR